MISTQHRTTERSTLDTEEEEDRPPHDQDMSMSMRTVFWQEHLQTLLAAVNYKQRDSVLVVRDWVKQSYRQQYRGKDSTDRLKYLHNVLLQVQVHPGWA